MKKSPIATVNEKFGTKAKLVEAVEKFTTDDLWVNRTNKDKGLSHVSNAKLLRLLATFTTVKEKYGTRAKLVDTILDLEKRSKDAGYKARLAAYPVPRLFDMVQTIEKRNKAAKPAAKKAAAKPAKKAAAPKKAAAKPAK
ncbi:MAG: hypothetical protein KBF88_08005 [Polyangiaceae bacterium]|nr:hypothetical protein [Polyangiaceae bacterium]